MDKKKKIAVIGLKGLPASGGAAVVGENLVQKLASRFSITVYAVKSHAGDLPADSKFRQIVFSGNRIKTLNTFLYFVKSALHALFAARYDLVHLHHHSSGFLLPFLRLRYPVVVTLHGIYRPGFRDAKFGRLVNSLIRFSQRLSVRFASELVSVSKIDALEIEKLYGRKPMYLPNGVKIPAESPAHAPENHIAFSAGRIYQIKGLHLLLEALHINNCREQLLVIGDLEHSYEYKQQIKKLSEGLKVIFVPLIREKEVLREKLSRARFVVLPSITEAMSMMLLEVAAWRVPMIISDIEANRAVLDDSEALYFRSGDAVSLAEKIREAYNNPDALRERALAAFNKVQRSHNWDEISECYQNIYDRLIN